MEEKRRIVEQTLSSDLSVAMMARQHGVNANQAFYWRKLYRAGYLSNNDQAQGVRLLPVSVNDEEPSPTGPALNTKSTPEHRVSTET
jgi:transposase